MLFSWHAGFIKDSLNLELLDRLDGLVEEVLKLSLDDLLLVKEVFNVGDSAVLGLDHGFVTGGINDCLVFFESGLQFCTALLVNCTE